MGNVITAITFPYFLNKRGLTGSSYGNEKEDYNPLDDFRRGIIEEIRDDTHMMSMKIVQFAGPPTPLVHLRPKFFHPLDLERSISVEPPTLSK